MTRTELVRLHLMNTDNYRNGSGKYQILALAHVFEDCWSRLKPTVMVGDKQDNKNSVEIEAYLKPRGF